MTPNLSPTSSTCSRASSTPIDFESNTTHLGRREGNLSDTTKIALASLFLMALVIPVAWLIIRAQRNLRLRAQAALAKLSRATGLNEMAASDGVFQYIRSYRSDHPLQCARGHRDGLDVELAMVPDLGGESDDGRVTIVGILCREKFVRQLYLALTNAWAIDRKMAVWMGVPTGPAAKFEVGPYSVWGDPMEAQRTLLLAHREAILQFPRKLRWLILNPEGALLVWNTPNSEWETDSTVVEKAFVLGTTPCRSL